jgi:hypothetical protein
MAGGLVVLVVAAGLGILALIPGVLPPLAGEDPNRLTGVLSQTIETKGIDAAAAQYRTLRAEGFPGLQESESDTNRHLWRMCTGLFIAVGSFFLGQPQVFPVAVRNSGLLVVPTLLVIVSLGYWLFRVNAFQRRTAAAKAQHIMSEAVAR